MHHIYSCSLRRLLKCKHLCDKSSYRPWRWEGSDNDMIHIATCCVTLNTVILILMELCTMRTFVFTPIQSWAILNFILEKTIYCVDRCCPPVAPQTFTRESSLTENFNCPNELMIKWLKSYCGRIRSSMGCVWDLHLTSPFQHSLLFWLYFGYHKNMVRFRQIA